MKKLLNKITMGVLWTATGAGIALAAIATSLNCAHAWIIPGITGALAIAHSVYYAIASNKSKKAVALKK